MGTLCDLELQILIENNLKKYIIFPCLLFSLLFTLSCEKEIELDLPDFESKIVVEAEVLSGLGPHSVKLSKTVSFLGEGDNPPIVGASVRIWDDVGQVDTLTEVWPGLYETSTLVGVIGRTYSLEVIAEGDTITAQGLMNRLNLIDSLSMEFLPEPLFFLDSGWYVTFHAPEAVGLGDFYRFRYFTNDSLHNDIDDLFFADDRVVDGNYISLQFPFDQNSGDSVRVEVLGISNTAYDYYLTMQQLITSAGNPFGSPPDNVVTNVSKNAFGFFLVASIDQKTVIIP